MGIQSNVVRQLYERSENGTLAGAIKLRQREFTGESVPEVAASRNFPVLLPVE